MVICLERCADLHMAQLMPLPLTVSCFSTIQIGFTFLVPAHPGRPGKRAVKRVCVCVCVWYGSQSAGLVTKKYTVNCKRKKSNTKISNYSVNYLRYIACLDIMVQTIRYERLSKFNNLYPSRASTLDSYWYRSRQSRDQLRP